MATTLKKNSKRSTRKNGSGVSENDILRERIALDKYSQNFVDLPDYQQIIRRRNNYIEQMETQRQHKLERNAKQYQDYATQIKNGQFVKIPLSQRYNPYSTHSRNLNTLYRSQKISNRRGGKLNKKTTKKTSKKIANKKRNITKKILI